MRYEGDSVPEIRSSGAQVGIRDRTLCARPWMTIRISTSLKAANMRRDIRQTFRARTKDDGIVRWIST